MGEKILTVLDILNLSPANPSESLELRCVSGQKGLGRRVYGTEFNRPGLTLSGFFEGFIPGRIQVFGNGEVAYLRKLEAENQTDTIERFFSNEIPCCIFTYGNEPPKFFTDIAERKGCAVLLTPLSSSEFITRGVMVFSNLLAEHKIVHGVLVTVFGVGVLILGESGIGKSETALELIERGHRLVADDSIDIYMSGSGTLVGTGANPIIGYHMEIRGLGIINIVRLYGVSAICAQCELQLIVQLSEWNSDNNYDRLGLDESTKNILGIEVPLVNIPVRPGRNIPIIIETAAKNERLKSMGVNSAKDFNKHVLNWIETNSTKAMYHGYEDFY